MKPPLRVLSLDGVGDAIQSYRFWRAGADNPHVTHITFAAQLYQACEDVGAELWVLGRHPRIERLRDGRFTIEHRGDDPAAGRTGLRYHLGVVRWAWQVLRAVRAFRADVLITQERPYPFLLHALRLFGVTTIVTLHCVLWPVSKPPSRVRRVLNRLDASFYRAGSTVVSCVSHDVKRQVAGLAGERRPIFVDFFPWLRSAVFEGIPPPDVARRPFRVLYAGRVEADKGVFDLLVLARGLQAAGRADVVFDLCGTGSALEAVRTAVAAEGLAPLVHVHGHCSQDAMRERLGQSHAVIVPTRTEFVEGFNMVVVEALLAGRPVISSPVCPAVHYVPEAVVTVPPNDVAAYRDAVLRLADDTTFYARLQSRAAASAARFLNPETSYHASLVHVLQAVGRRTRPTQREVDAPAANQA